MSLTTPQLATLKAAILADPVLAAYPNTADGAFDMARDKLNVTASPAYIVWTDQMTPDQYDAGLIAGATQIDALTQGKRDQLFMIGRSTRNCGDLAVRAAIDDATGSQNALKAALVAVTKRSALLIEKILTTGAGTSGAPSTLVWTGRVDYNDVLAARNS